MSFYHIPDVNYIAIHDTNILLIQKDIFSSEVLANGSPLTPCQHDLMLR